METKVSLPPLLKAGSKSPRAALPARDESNGFLSSILSVAHNAANIIGHQDKEKSHSSVALASGEEGNKPTEADEKQTETDAAKDIKGAAKDVEVTGHELLPSNVHFLPVHNSPLATLGNGDLLLTHFDRKKRASDALQLSVTAAEPSKRLSVSGVQDNKVVRRKSISNGSMSDKANMDDSEASDDDKSVTSDNSELDQILDSSTVTTANPKRNREFHHTFRKIPATEALISEFLCALSKDILVQGKMFLSHNYICFNSNILGWVTNLMIPLQEVIQIEKKSTAVLFPNGMIIRTLHHKYVFATFLSRDATFNLITKVWHNALQETQDDSVKLKGIRRRRKSAKAHSAQDSEDAGEADSSDIDESMDDFSGEDNNFSRKSSVKAKPKAVADADDADSEITSESEPEDDEAEDNSKDSSPSESSGSKKKGQVFNGFAYSGPATHLATETGYSKQQGELEVLNQSFKAPLGVVFALLFGPNKDYIVSILEKQKNFDILKDTITELSSSQKERDYTYIKPLSGPVGPKQTKCIIKETLKSFDLSKYVEVEQVTQTPDVPLGGSFKIRTKLFLSWAQDNSTNLNVITIVEWTAKSWIKGAVEKGSIEGQKDSMKVLSEGLSSLIAAGGSSGGEKRKRKKSKASLTAVPPPKEEPVKEEPKPLTASEHFSALLEFVGLSLPIQIPMVSEAMTGGVVLILLLLMYSYILLWMLGSRSSRIDVSTYGDGYSKMIMLNNNKYQLLPTPDTYLGDEQSRKVNEAKMWQWINERTSTGGVAGNSQSASENPEFDEIVKLTKQRVDNIYKLLDV